MEARNLEKIREEVKSIKDSQGEPIDKKIKDLIVGLKRWGIRTTASCQGHLFRGLPYPWVDISWESLDDLARIIGLHWRNVPPGGDKKPAAAKPTWVIKPRGTFLRIIPENKGWWKLWQLQKEAVKFGRFLQQIPDNFFKKEPEG